MKKSLLLTLAVMMTLLLALGMTAAQNETIKIVTAQQNAKVRTTASTSSALVGSLPTGQTAQILEETSTGENVNGNATWYRIQLPNNKEGWVWSGTVKVDEVTPTPSPTPRPTLPPNPDFQPITSANVGQLRLIKEIGRGNPTGIAWSPDGLRLLISTTTGFWVYDAKNFEQGAKEVFSFDLPISDYELGDIGFVGNSNNIFYYTKTVLQVLNLETHMLGPNIAFNMLPGDSGKAAVSADGRTFALLDRDGIRLMTPTYDSHQQTIIGFQQEVPLNTDYTPTSVALSLDGRKLAISGNYTLAQMKATGHQGNRLQIYSLPSRELLVSGKVSGEMLFSADGSRITFVGTFMRFFTVDALTGKKLFEYPKTGFQLADADLNPNGTQLAVVYPGLRGIDLFDATQGKRLNNLSERGYGNGVDFSPNGQLLAHISDDDGTITIRDANTNEVLYRDRFIPLTSNVYLDEMGENITYILGGSVEFQTVSDSSNVPFREIPLPEWADNFWLSDDGQNLLFIGLRVEDGQFVYRTQTWNSDGSPISDVQMFDMVSSGGNSVSQPIRAVAYHPNGQLVAFARQEGFVSVHSIATLEEVTRFPRHSKPLTQVKISDDGNYLVAGGLEPVVRVWKMDGTEVQQLAIPQDVAKRSDGFYGINYLSISADGSRVVAGDGYDLFIWDVSSGTLIKRITQAEINKHWIIDATLHPNGDIITVATERGLIFFDIASDQVLPPSPIDNLPVNRMSYSTNASTLLGYGGGTGNLFVWGIPRSPQITLDPAATLIFQDDFEQGNLIELDDPGVVGRIIEENGNHILHFENNSDDFVGAALRLADRSDIRIEARVRVERPTTFYNPADIFFNIRESSTGSYAVFFSGQMPEFGVFASLRGRYPWVGGNILGFKPALHQWFKLRIESFGSQLRLYVNDHLMADISNNTHDSGTISFTIAPQAIVDIDDLSVSDLVIQAIPTITPIPTLTMPPTITATPTPTHTPSPTMTPSPTATSTPIPVILFQDDFEDGDLSPWDNQNSVGRIVSDDSNHFVRLENDADGYSILSLLDKSWSDYAFEASVRIERSSPSATDLFVNMRGNADGGYGGTLDTESSAAGILAGYKGNYYDLGTVNVAQPMNQWFRVRIQTAGEQIKLYLNDVLIQSATASYSSEGNISFTVGPHTIVEIDDVKVIDLTSNP